MQSPSFDSDSDENLLSELLFEEESLDETEDEDLEADTFEKSEKEDQKIPLKQYLSYQPKFEKIDLETLFKQLQQIQADPFFPYTNLDTKIFAQLVM